VGRLVHFSGIADADPKRGLDRLDRALRSAGSNLASVAQLVVFARNAAAVAPIEAALCARFGRAQPAPAVAVLLGDPLEAGATVLYTGVAAAKGEVRSAVKPAGWPELPCRSHAVQVGDTLLLGGFTGRPPWGGPIPATDDVKQQAHVALEAVGQVLAAAGMSHADLVAGRVFLARASDFAPMNEAYKPFFAKEPPARATVVARTPIERALFQVVYVAVKHPERKVVRAGAGPAAEDKGVSLPYSPSIRVGERLYLAGTVGSGPPSDIGAQTERSLASLGKTLEAAPWPYSSVVDAFVYVTGPAAAAASRPVLARRLAGARYVQTFVGVELVIPEPRIEIMLTALDPSSAAAGGKGARGGQGRRATPGADGPIHKQ
jgi:2-iminobutanoate/2-iminopropanoate deaminase